MLEPLACQETICLLRSIPPRSIDIYGQRVRTRRPQKQHGVGKSGGGDDATFPT
jgi:hypothetical protein